MDRSDLARQIVGYNGWANLRLLEAARASTGVASGRTEGASFGTVLGTLSHIYNAQVGWMERWLGRGDPPDVDLDDVEQVIDAFAHSQADLEAYVAHWLDAEWDEMLTYVSNAPHTRSRGAMLNHVISHSTYHRGEAALILTAAGWSPGDLDLLDYLGEGV